MKQSNEVKIFKAAEHGARILMDSGAVVLGKIVWTEDYTVGVVPFPEGNEPSVLDGLGMKASTESLVYKGFIRSVTPIEEKRDGQQARSEDPVRGLQPMAPANRQPRATARGR